MWNMDFHNWNPELEQDGHQGWSHWFWNKQNRIPVNQFSLNHNIDYLTALIIKVYVGKENVLLAFERENQLFPQTFISIWIYLIFYTYSKISLILLTAALPSL